jgi:chitodextrinase/beta-glucosidase/6-phospho-beta-glucosidase/beta-galactosidase
VLSYKISLSCKGSLMHKIKQVLKKPFRKREIKSDFRFSKHIAYLYGAIFSLIGGSILYFSLAASSQPPLAKGAVVICSMANQEAPELAAAGVKWVRVQTMPWDSTEYDRGKFSNDHLDRFKACFNIYHSYGIKVLALIDNTPQWAAQDPNRQQNGIYFGLQPPANDQDFADYFSYVVPYMGGSVDAWEIYNEPDDSAYWAANNPQADYLNMLKAAYSAIKAADQQAGLSQKVIMAGLETTHNWDNDWTNYLFSNGAYKYTDALTLHAYPGGNCTSAAGDPTNNFYDIIHKDRQAADQYRGSHDQIPIWLTEFDYAYCNSPDSASQGHLLQQLLDYYNNGAGKSDNLAVADWFIADGVPLGDTNSGVTTTQNSVWRSSRIFDDPYVNATSGPWQIGPRPGMNLQNTTIDWGDGTTSTDHTHTYASVGDYTTHITMDFGSDGKQSFDCLVSVRYNTVAPSNCPSIQLSNRTDTVTHKHTVTAKIGGSPWLTETPTYSVYSFLKTWPASQPAPSAKLTLSGSGSSLSVKLDASSDYSNIKQVDYYSKTGKIQSITTYPYQLDLSKLAAGTYDKVVAVVADYNGQQTTSNSVDFTIGNTNGNGPPALAKSVNFACADSSLSDAQRSLIINQMKAAGVSWIHINAIAWNGFEPYGDGNGTFNDHSTTPPKFVTPGDSAYPGDIARYIEPNHQGRIDSCVRLANNAGIKVILDIEGTPLWAEQDPNANNEASAPKSEYVKYYADFVKYEATHYKGQIAVWELGNEVDDSAFWTNDDGFAIYAAELHAAYPVAKAADPNALVIMASSGHPGGGGDNGGNFIQTMYQSYGAKNYTDAVAIHPYAYNCNQPGNGIDGDPVIWKIKRIQDIMRSAGDPAKLLLADEASYSTVYCSGDFQLVSQRLTQFYAAVSALDSSSLQPPYIQLLSWYPTDTAFLGPDPSGSQAGSRLLTNLDFKTLHYAPTPIYCALKNWPSSSPNDSTAPSIPANLHSTAVSDTAVSLAWNASPDNSGGCGLDYYEIYRGGTFLANSNTTSYVDTSARAGQTYSYTVRSLDNSGNESAQSAAFSVTTTANNNPPVTKAVNVGMQDCNDAESEVPLLAAAGVKWARFSWIVWSRAEPKRGEYSQAYLDQLKTCFNIFNKYGIKVSALVGFTPRWASRDPSLPANWRPPKDNQDFADLLTHIVPILKDNVRAWEIWDEVNLPSTYWIDGTNQDYAKLLKASSPAVKNADPSALVLSAGSSQPDTGWFNAMYAIKDTDGKAILSKYSDVFAVHPYPGIGDGLSCPAPTTPGNQFLKVGDVYKIMNDNGDGSKPIWFTEMGYGGTEPVGGTPAPCTDSLQAQRLTEALNYTQQNYPYVKVAAWYTTNVSSTGGASSPWYRYRLLDDPIAAGQAFRPRPVYSSLKNYNADNIAPSVSITSPADKSVASGTQLTVNAKASDNYRVAGVTFKLDDVKVGSEDQDSPYSQSVDLSQKAIGDHTITATARDDYGNTSTSSITITIKDTVPPTVKMTAPANSSIFRSGDKAKLSAQASDNGSGVASVQFYDNGQKIGDGARASAATGASSSPQYKLSALGASTVFNANTNGTCAQITDLPVSAFKAGGQLQLIAANGSDNYRFSGPTINSLTFGCSSILSAGQNPDPSKFNDFEWLAGTYTNDGQTVYGLVHEEYHGWLYPNQANAGCSASASSAKSDRFKCWYSAVTFAKSSDGGQTFTDNGQIVAALPYKYTKDTGTASGYGMETPSGIVKSPTDGYYYALVTQIFPTTVASPQNGECLIRTNDLGTPASWRGWDGGGFNVKFANPYTGTGSGVCSPVIKAANVSTLHGGLTYNSYIKQYILMGRAGPQIGDFSYMTSPDLVHWSSAKVFYTADTSCSSVHYPSLIDPASSSISFDVTGQTATLFYTKFDLKSDCQTLKSRSLTSVPIQITTAQANYDYNWTIPADLGDGSHKITALATDNAGNTATSAATNITVDNTPPTISAITAPSRGATVSGSSVTIKAKAVDNTGVGRIQFILDGSGSLGPPITKIPYQYIWNTTALGDGPHTLSVVATDKAGNSASAETVQAGTITVTVHNASSLKDITPPTVPANLHVSAITQTSISLGWDASTDPAHGSDPISGVKDYKVYRDGVYVATTTLTNYTDTGLVSHTSYKYQINAEDNAGNQSVKTAKLQAKTAAPPPDVSLGALSNLRLHGTVSISAQADSIVGVANVQFYINPGTTYSSATATKLGPAATRSPYVVNFDTTKYTDGAYVLTAIATDTGGQPSKPASISVVIDNTPPTVAIISPKNGAILKGTVKLSAKANDNDGVAGVQFMLNSTGLLGSELKSAPYTYIWDTTNYANGSYKITALAPDLAGNKTTSALIDVTLNNRHTKPDTTPPSVPTNLAADSIAQTSARLSWKASSDNVGGSGLAGYAIYRDGQLLTTTTHISFIDTNLIPGTTYNYTLAAYDKAGNTSAQTPPVSITTAPLAVKPGDANGDGKVDITDLSILLTGYGRPGLKGDFNHDGKVDVVDLSILLSNYGK